MMTVYGYGFSEPVVEEPKPQGPGMMTYLLVAGALYFGWKQGWFKSVGAMGAAAPAQPVQGGESK